MSSDGAALLAAAVRAACQAGAPRRTVQAVAAAVTGVLVRPTSGAVPHSDTRRPAGAQSNACEEAGDPLELLSSLRAARKAQRQRKKERRRVAKLASTTETKSISTLPTNAADHDKSSGEILVVESAPALASPPVVQSGLDLQSDGGHHSVVSYAPTLSVGASERVGIQGRSHASSVFGDTVAATDVHKGKRGRGGGKHGGR